VYVCVCTAPSHMYLCFCVCVLCGVCDCGLCAGKSGKQQCGVSADDDSVLVQVRVRVRPYVRVWCIACEVCAVTSLTPSAQLHALLKVLWSGKWCVATPVRDACVRVRVCVRVHNNLTDPITCTQFALRESVWRHCNAFRNYKQVWCCHVYVCVHALRSMTSLTPRTHSMMRKSFCARSSSVSSLKRCNAVFF
jgi:hypothetical protein